MICKELFQKIDELNEKYLDILEDVCNIESPTSFKEGVDKVGKYFINMAKKRGWKVEISKQEISGDAICITMNPDIDNAPVSLSGHIDTVHPIGLFSYPAVIRDKKNMYGPGVMDCKGGVVAAFMAMDALRESGFKGRPVKLIIQSDEENSSRTSNKKTVEFMCKKAENSVAFLNLEGYVKNTAVIIRKGILRYKFTVVGKACHSSKCNLGANAIAEAAHKIIELEKMKDDNGLTCCCGIINGGTAVNTVAEECMFYADIRFSTDEEVESVKKTVKKIADTSNIEGCTCNLEEISFRPAMIDSEKNRALLKKINEIYQSNDLPILSARKNLSGSDAAYITQIGVPCIDSIGTEGKYIHSKNEYIELKSLAESAKRIASVVFCI